MTSTASPGDRRMTIERLTGFAGAWRDRDVDRLMSFMTDDCVFRASVGTEPGTTFRGREAVRRGFKRVLAYDTDVDVHLGAVFISGDRGAAQWSYSRPGDDAATVHGCDLYEFAGDRIRVKDAYRKVRAELAPEAGR